MAAHRPAFDFFQQTVPIYERDSSSGPTRITGSHRGSLFGRFAAPDYHIRTQGRGRKPQVFSIDLKFQAVS
ncbi:hypothetical protein GRJ2_001520900 [Grus japonensis]|uniref:Uncharacterized protein n=1 Tax=Grus japonensis TaxID=30415 RepID=A0ABC9WYQ9_GRUJA